MNKRQYKKYIRKKYPGSTYKGLRVSIKNVERIANLFIGQLRGKM